MNPNFKRVVAAILPFGDGRYLFQLRDFHEWIDHPGHWGLFAGQIDPGEAPEAAIRRELREELGCELAEAKLIKIFEFPDAGLIAHAFVCRLNTELNEPALNEGQELGAFSPTEIRSGILPSKKWGRTFPIIPEALRIFEAYSASLI